jgi:hypothetical protein
MMPGDVMTPRYGIPTAVEEGGHPAQYTELQGAGSTEEIIFVESDDEWPQITADPDSETSRAIVNASASATNALST